MPAWRMRSSFCCVVRQSEGVYGYSHASNRGVAQYEFGIGRGVVEVKAGVRVRSDGGEADLELEAAAAVYANARVVAADCILVV